MCLSISLFSNPMSNCVLTLVTLLSEPRMFTVSTVQILRSHVMVRVGGGWDTLQNYLDKHDPCRCRRGRTTYQTKSGELDNSSF